MRINGSTSGDFRPTNQRQERIKRIARLKDQAEEIRKNINQTSKKLEMWQGARSGEWMKFSDQLKTSQESYKMIMQEIAQLELEEKKSGRKGVIGTDHDKVKSQKIAELPSDEKHLFSATV